MRKSYKNLIHTLGGALITLFKTRLKGIGSIIQDDVNVLQLRKTQSNKFMKLTKLTKIVIMQLPEDKSSIFIEHNIPRRRHSVYRM